MIFSKVQCLELCGGLESYTVYTIFRCPSAKVGVLPNLPSFGFAFTTVVVPMPLVFSNKEIQYLAVTWIHHRCGSS